MQKQPFNQLAEHLKSLLALELTTEKEETLILRQQFSVKQLAQVGICATKQKIFEVKSGLCGSILVSFVPKSFDENESKEKPEKTLKFSNGDIVGIFESNKIGNDPIDSGIVSRVSGKIITVSFKSLSLDDSDSEKTYGIILLANQITYDRSVEALSKIAESKSSVKDILLNTSIPKFQINENLENHKIKFFNSYLNLSQKEAILFCLSANDLALIHGPPGTGKTTTVVEYIAQEVHRGKRLIVCGPSNISVDNLLEKLIDPHYKINAVRVGHPSRISENLQKFTLDYLISQTNNASIVFQSKNEMNKLVKELSKTKIKSKRTELQKQCRLLKKDICKYEKLSIIEILKNMSVVLSTNASAGDKNFKLLNKNSDKIPFDICVIDEAAQAIEPTCWIPILMANKLILAGDHKQLEPTIKSIEASKKGLNITLFDRMLQLYGQKVTAFLDTQYRFNTTIMNWASKAMYENRLKADSSVANRTILQLQEGKIGELGLEEIPNSELFTNPMLFIDTAGSFFGESVDKSTVIEAESKFNIGEAFIIKELIKDLQQIGVEDFQIGVITPYNAQVNYLISIIRPDCKCEISTVDGFQGREKDIILISSVRSNPQKEVGFLSNERRFNVAVTRAKYFVCIVGDSETLGSNKFLKDLIKYIVDKGNIMSIQQYGEGRSIESNIGAFAETSKNSKQIKTKNDSKEKK